MQLFKSRYHRRQIENQSFCPAEFAADTSEWVTLK